MSDQINSMPKYVVSTTLIDPEWTNTTVISGGSHRRDQASQAGRRQGHRPVRLRTALLCVVENDLLDELRLWVHPLFVGDAAAEDLLFKPSSAALFELVGAQTLD